MTDSSNTVLSRIQRLVELQNARTTALEETLQKEKSFIQEIKQYALTQPFNPDCLYIAGQIFEQEHDSLNALTNYHKAALLNHQPSKQQYQLLETELLKTIPQLRDQKQYSQAMEYCAVLLELNSQHTHATYFAGTIHIQQQNIEQAIACFEKLPNHSSAQAQLAKLRAIYL